MFTPSSITALRKLWPLLLSAAWMAHAVPGPGATTLPTASVLVLDEDDGTRPAHLAFLAAFRAHLTEALNAPVVVYADSLDFARFGGETYRTDVEAWLRKKYANRSMDCLVVGNAKTLDLALRLRPALWPRARIVFAAIGEETARPYAGQTNLTGVTFDLQTRGTLEAAWELFPSSRRIALLGSGSAYPEFYQEARAGAERFAAGRCEFVALTNSGLAEATSALASQPPGTLVVFFLGSFHNEAGVPRSQASAMAEIRRHSPGPIFGQTETLIGHGIIGGHCYVPSLMGEEVGHKVALALATPDAGTIPVTRSQAQRLIFDWAELRKWHINPARLPPGSEIRNRQFSFWESYRWHVLGVLLIGLAETGLIIGLLIQRASRRRAESKTRQLAGRLISAHEEERRRMGREIHDDITQRLARLTMDAGLLAQQAKSPPGPLPALRDSLSRLTEDVHELAYQLHPSALFDLGLVETLREECVQFTQRHACRLDFQPAPDFPRLSQDAELCLFRVAQEALRNIARHAGASAVVVTLGRAEKGVQLSVQDNGCGFAPSQPVLQNHLGLSSMRERAELLGGRFELESQPGRGTSVFVFLPWPQGGET